MEVIKGDTRSLDFSSREGIGPNNGESNGKAYGI